MISVGDNFIDEQGKVIGRIVTVHAAMYWFQT